MGKDKLYIEHILEAILKIRGYIHGVTLEEFKKNNLVHDAVIRELEIIGEASHYISDEIIGKYPDVPWAQITGMRNKLIHEYFGVDLEIVWKTVTEKLEILGKKLEEIK